MTKNSPPPFIPGLDLAELFYKQIVKPILSQSFPDLAYSSALIGSGSEVLGFDTEMSSDHHWGPRVMIFVSSDDWREYQGKIRETLSQKLPRIFRGYPTSFTAQDPADKGVQVLDYAADGHINHRVEILTIAGFLNEYLGFDVEREITPRDWLTFPEQKLLAISAGRIFHDELGLDKVRQKFAYYPREVWLYLLASCWTRIEQEEHLMGRAGSVGDEIGSALIGARLVRDVMRLCFLMEKRYAPYAKWLGTAFRGLACAQDLEPLLWGALSATTWQDRERYLSRAYEHVAKMHNSLSISEPLPEQVSHFFDRPFLVISQGRFSAAIRAAMSDPEVTGIASRRLIGNIDQLSDNTDLLEDLTRRAAVRRLYE